MLDDPRVGKDIVEGDARGLLLDEQLGDEIACLRAHKVREGVRDSGDELERLLLFLVIKGRLSDEELVQEYTDGPEVDARVVLAALDHLRCEVVERTAESATTSRRTGNDGPAKVRKFDVTVLGEEDVLGLEVPVDDVLLVTVDEGLCDLSDVAGSLGLREAALLLETAKEFSFGGVLHEDVDVGVVVKVTEHPEDVLVAQVGLDLDLTSELLSHLIILDGIDGQDLEGDDLLGSLFTDLVHSSKVASSNLLAEFKVVQCPSSLAARSSLLGSVDRRGGMCLSGTRGAQRDSGGWVEEGCSCGNKKTGRRGRRGR